MINIESIYNKVCNKVLNENNHYPNFKRIISEAHTEGASDHEYIVADEISKFFDSISNKPEFKNWFTLKACRPDRIGSRYSDIKIYDDSPVFKDLSFKKDSVINDYVWIEVKQGHNAFIYNGKAAYRGDNWTGGGINFTASTKFKYKGYESAADDGLWNVLGGSKDKSSNELKQTFISKRFRLYLNAIWKRPDSKSSKSPKIFLQKLVEFLNKVKTIDSKEYKTYLLENKNIEDILTFINYFAIFRKEVTNYNNIPFIDENELKNIFSFTGNKINKEKLDAWLSSIKDLTLGDILFVGGGKELKKIPSGQVSLYVIKIFLKWFNEEESDWPRSETGTNKGMRTRKLLDIPIKFDQKLIQKIDNASINHNYNGLILLEDKNTRLYDDEDDRYKLSSDLEIDNAVQPFDLKQILIDHYTSEDKERPAYYIQTGDDFFGLDSSKNPLEIEDLVYLDNPDIFKDGLNGTNYLQLGYQSENRTEAGYTIKFKVAPINNWAAEGVSSKYSFLPDKADDKSWPVINPVKLKDALKIKHNEYKKSFNLETIKSNDLSNFNKIKTENNSFINKILKTKNKINIILTLDLAKINNKNIQENKDIKLAYSYKYKCSNDKYASKINLILLEINDNNKLDINKFNKILSSAFNIKNYTDASSPNSALIKFLNESEDLLDSSNTLILGMSLKDFDNPIFKDYKKYNNIIDPAKTAIHEISLNSSDAKIFANLIENKNKSIKEAEEDPSKKTIALVGGSFKPPHAGHFDMVEQYAKKADKVIVVISDPKKSIRTTKNGTVITPKMAKAIWDIYVDRYSLGNKVEVKISSQASPIAAIYDYIDNTLKDCNIILGASKKDNDFKRFAKAESYFVKEGRDDINILDPETTAVDPYANNGKPISAGQIRDNIDDPEIIKTMLPKKLNSDDIDSIISILSDEI